MTEQHQHHETHDDHDHGHPADQEAVRRLQEQVDELNRRVSELTGLLAESELARWRGRIDELRLQAKLAEMELREEYADELEELEGRLAEARDAFEDLTGVAGMAADATEEAWEAAMNRLRPMLTELRDGIGRVARAMRGEQ